MLSSRDGPLQTFAPALEGPRPAWDPYDSGASGSGCVVTNPSPTRAAKLGA